ncbi:MAG: hypothetical protein ACTTJE_07605 [Schwartzia sp. (in: firmicutes)]
MRPQKNKLADIGRGASVGNFLLNFAVAVFWLFRWLGRGIRHVMRGDFVGRRERQTCGRV